ncbi:hypothetical protein COU91_00510 [Candidatus Saccharibacteria bacterium CG10_big_fil_rev_8_21_14_0_10_47_8]|nr:MAG: hypothetical protein COU91_00510 [Candidatus Saccharibacteria bacterium CG10_big_fil_rev_8_21_14_0_10_47_8]
MVGSVIVAPNAVQLGDKALKFLDKRGRKLKVKTALSYMNRKNLIEYKKSSDGVLNIVVTEKGRRREQKVRFEELKIKKPKRWDKQWRLVTFDIPESRRKSRSLLSSKLKLLGFHQLQKSVWVHPYPCGLEIELIKQFFKIPDEYIIFAKVSSIDNHNQLVKHFNFRD